MGLCRCFYSNRLYHYFYMSTIISIIITLSGCATIPSRSLQKFDGVVNQETKTIGLIVAPAFPDSFFINNEFSASEGFGLLGVAAAASDMRSKSEQFSALMKENKLNIVDEFRDSLCQELQKTGYLIKVLKFGRPNQNSFNTPLRGDYNVDFMNNYDNYDKDVDAYMEVIINSGYRTNHFENDYLPSVRVRVLLVNKSKKVLYYTHISYGYAIKSVRFIEPFEYINVKDPDSRYRFKNFDEITNNLDRSVMGLRQGIPFLTQKIAYDLKK